MQMLSLLPGCWASGSCHKCLFASELTWDTVGQEAVYNTIQLLICASAWAATHDMTAEEQDGLGSLLYIGAILLLFRDLQTSRKGAQLLRQAIDVHGVSKACCIMQQTNSKQLSLCESHGPDTAISGRLGRWHQRMHAHTASRSWKRQQVSKSAHAKPLE